MAPPANRDLNRLTLHVALQQLVWSVADGFSAAFLFRQGLTPAAIYLAAAVVFALRFLLRPAVLAVVRWTGLKAALILGVALSALQAMLLAFVHRIDGALAAYLTVAALAEVFYWPTYHAMFATVGDAEKRGAQVGLRQALIATAGIAGPAAGGLALTFGGPKLAFGAAAAVALIAIAPLLGCADHPIAPTAPPGAYRGARRGALLFVTDGWITSCVAWAWGLVVFQSLGARFDAFGGAMAAAALAGAVGGLILGRSIDAGGARRAVWINALVLTTTILARALCGQQPIAVLSVAIGAALLGGLYTPSLMTAIYNEAKASPCPLRYHLALEAGWDGGAILACLAAAAVLSFGASLQLVIVMALPPIALQAWNLRASYAAVRGEIEALGSRTQIL
ncbi:MAG: MFS transporter [Bradyrhizobium sp.]|nr:MAG: MFS transporter [Bradyrhizobium sp.]